MEKLKFFIQMKLKSKKDLFHKKIYKMKNEKYNLAVIGGGPAGIIASGRASELDLKVVLLETNNTLGVKLLITGKGRCNITNAEQDLKKFINNYGLNGKFLYSALNKFSNKDIVNFFEKYGIKTKIEKDNRIFPISDKSKDILNCLIKYLQDSKVKIKLNSEVEKIILKNKKIKKIILKNKQEVFADNFLIATGGKSYPKTGSIGDGYKWLKKLGHTIIKPKPSLVPIIVQEKIIQDLEGLSLKNVVISLWQEKKITSCFGEAIFTNNGLSGPIVLNLSRKINRLKNLSNLKIKIDFKPSLDYPKLDKIILNNFNEQKNKQFKNSLDKLLPKKLIPVIIKLSNIKKNKQVNEITKIERKKILKLLKEFELNFQSLANFEKAIITSGGVYLKEINPQTMKSKIISNLYFAGEILDIDGPTGGYNLQICWSTGYLVGEILGKNK